MKMKCMLAAIVVMFMFGSLPFLAAANEDQKQTIQFKAAQSANTTTHTNAAPFYNGVSLLIVMAIGITLIKLYDKKTTALGLDDDIDMSAAAAEKIY